MHQAHALCMAAHSDLGLGGYLTGEGWSSPPSGTRMPQLPACSSLATMGVPDVPFVGSDPQCPGSVVPPEPG